MIALQHADRVLGWQENVSDEEMPPEWMWPFTSELERWFAQVEADREDRSRGNSRDRELLGG